MSRLKLLLAVLTLTIAGSIFAQGQTVTLPSTTGQNISINGQSGKVVVLALGATWLPLSKNQATILNKLSKKYAGRDVEFYFIATDSTAVKSKNYATDEQVQAFATRNKLTIPVLRDSDGAIVLKKFAVDQVPSFVVLNKQGKSASEPFGGLTPTPEAENDLATQISQKIDGIL